MISHETVVLDVREDIRSGLGPCSRIMESAGQLGDGDILRVIAPFEPTPLYDVLGREGFVHESREIGDGDWEVRFMKTPKVAGQPAPQACSEPHGGCGGAATCVEVLEVDARGLAPPQPMVLILDALAALPEGATLRAFTDRQPMHLLDQLARRGFHGESQETPRGDYITVVRQL